MARSAFDAYKENLAQVEVQIARLQAQVKRHEKDAAAVTVHWGHVGDLAQINERLAELTLFAEAQ